MDLFIDAHQYGRIAQAQRDATTARHKAETFDQRLHDAERRLDRLSLACQALWELLKERTDLTQEQVYSKMDEVDQRDGRKDGKIRGIAIACSSCNRTTNTMNHICIYCGTPVRTPHIV